jgi:dihydropteroate synthase
VTRLFLTGKLAENNLRRVLADMAPLDFDYRVHVFGVSVAALITDKMLLRRLKPDDLNGIEQVILPGRCRGDLDALNAHFGVEFIRGPDEVADLPLHFGKARKTPDLSRHSVQIFAEIVDAPERDIESILARAEYYRSCGADIIDIGCLPEEPFPLMEEAINVLHKAGFKVSVDSLNEADLIRANRAGADYLLSLTEHSLHIAEEGNAIPILVPAERGDLASLERAMAIMEKQGKLWIADPIIEPIHFGLTNSIVRYHTLRERHPEANIMMGIGNLTELTDADTNGINAMLFGIISELNIGNVLATEVSPHARRAITEADKARRMMFAAKQDDALPRDYSDALLSLHERRPFPDSADDISELASQIKDPSYRIKLSEDGIHLFNREGIHQHTDPFEFYPKLDLKADDTGHAFYLGVELGRAEIAWQLGKRYTQDEPLTWGCATPENETEDLTTQKQAGTTFDSPKDRNNKKDRTCGTAE